jgi:hypothetical protein
MHWCMDETLAVLAMIPFIGYFFRKIHAWYHAKMGHVCHEKHCEDKHVDHPYSPYDRANWHKDQVVSEADMEYLRGEPAPLKITIPVDIWDSISEEDIIERFGKETVKDAQDYLLEGASFTILYAGEMKWFVNNKAEIMVTARGRTFVHDNECCEHGWREI